MIFAQQSCKVCAVFIPFYIILKLEVVKQCAQGVPLISHRLGALALGIQPLGCEVQKALWSEQSL